MFTVFTVTAFTLTIEGSVSVEELFQRAVTAHQAGEFPLAEQLYREVISAQPEHVAGLTNLGVLLARRGELDEAEQMYAKAVQVNPNLPDVYFNLGNLHRRRGRLREAATAYGTVLRLKSEHARAWQLLGLVAGDAGDWPTAVQYFRNALNRNPNTPEVYSLLWDALTRVGHTEEAEAVIRESVTRFPEHPSGHMNLGLTLTALGRTEEAITELETALKLRPEHAETHNALGVALDAAARSDHAAANYREAIRLRPDFADAWSNLGLSLGDQGRIREAVDVLKRATDIRPDPVIASNRLLLLLSASGASPIRLRAEHEEWATRYAAELLPKEPMRYPEPGKRLRIGYVFAEPRNRATAAFLEVLLSRHDHTRFHVTGYPNARDTIAGFDRLRHLADAWRPVVGLSDAAASELIQSDAIDVLVDLCGHMAGNRLLMFARKPARVQITLFGYPFTTGLKAIDYRVTDGLADPPDSEMFSVEQLLRLPDVGRLYIPPTAIPDAKPLPAGNHRTFTFGCLNTPAKLSDLCLDMWARVLKAVPMSRLVLQAGRSTDAARHLAERFTRLGVSSDRLELVYRMPETEYLEAYRTLDLALDPFPFNGRATTCDALWMGVPVLTVAGPGCRGRQGVSILTTVGLPDFVAADYDKFVELAATWADQRDALADLRESLREMLISSPVTNADQYIRELESAYQTSANPGLATG